jgi:hypothetical protein
MITGELTWQQFKSLDSIRNLNESQQAEHYYKYLTELNDWISHQNKGPIPSDTPSGPELPADSILFNGRTGGVYRYDPVAETSTLLTIPGTAVTYLDIAHTQTKLWLNASGKVDEWNITLNPFTAAVSRTVGTPHTLGNGLGVVSNTVLLGTNTATSPQSVVTLDITTNSAASTYKFDLEADREVTGDILLTTTNKVIVLTSGVGAERYISQYDYTTGVIELDERIDTPISDPSGVFIYDNKIQIIDSSGAIYLIGKVAPYSIALVGNTGVQVGGVSQLPEYLTTNFS